MGYTELWESLDRHESYTVQSEQKDTQVLGGPTYPMLAYEVAWTPKPVWGGPLDPTSALRAFMTPTLSH